MTSNVIVSSAHTFLKTSTVTIHDGSFRLVNLRDEAVRLRTANPRVIEADHAIRTCYNFVKCVY